MFFIEVVYNINLVILYHLSSLYVYQIFMMTTEKYDLNWHTFTDHLVDKYKQLFSTKLFSDVTLVCDDMVKFRAHRFVLSSGSEFFKSILDDDLTHHHYISLDGISSVQMNKILDFHVETHIDGIVYNCPYCDKTFKTRNSVKCHKSMYHRNAKLKVVT